MGIPIRTPYQVGVIHANNELTREALKSHEWDVFWAIKGPTMVSGLGRIVFRGVIAGLVWDTACLIARVVQLIFTCGSDRLRGYYWTKVQRNATLVAVHAPAQILRGVIEMIPFVGCCTKHKPAIVCPYIRAVEATE